jgi:hypothetical protein
MRMRLRELFVAKYGLIVIVIAASPVSHSQEIGTDLSGTWWNEAPLPGAPPGTPPDPRTGVEVIAPLNLTDEGSAMMASFDPLNDPAVECEFPGLLRLILNPYPLAIELRRDAVLIHYEEWTTQRTIYLNSEMPVISEPDPLGHSVGDLEGATLTVTTKGLSRGLGRIPAFIWTSEQATIVEQYYLTERGQLVGEVEIEDPVMLRSPLRVRKTWNPYDGELLDFDCVLRDR